MVISLRYIYFFLFFSILGTLSHFVYNINKSFIIKIFFPIDESPFQHIKLITFPALVLLIYELINKANAFYNVISLYGIAMFLSTLLMLMFHYFIKCGFNIKSLTIDILSFYIASFIFTFLIKYVNVNDIFLIILGILLFIATIFSSIIFSFFKINLPLFNENKNI